MPKVQIVNDALINYEGNLVTLLAGTVIDGDLALFLTNTSGVPVQVLDEAPPKTAKTAKVAPTVPDVTVADPKA